MLDLLRKQAQSTKVRVLFAGIILTFVLFFGFSSFQEKFQSADAIVAEVDGTEISEGLFNLFYEQNLSRLKSSMKNDAELPDFITQFAKTNTLRDLVRRSVALRQADRLGLRISDEFLAQKIIESHRSNGEDFDPIAYQTNYLPYFSRTYGINLEDIVRQDLTLQQLALLFAAAGPPVELANPDASMWTFEAIALEEAALQEKGAIKEAGELTALAKTLIDSPERWKALAKELGLESKTYGPVTIKTRHELEPIARNYEELVKLFGLSLDHPMLETPLGEGKRLVVVRLLEKTKAKDEAAPTALPQLQYLDAWIFHAQANAKVASFIDEAQASQ